MSVSCNCPDCITAIWDIDCFLYGVVPMYAEQLVAACVKINLFMLREYVFFVC